MKLLGTPPSAADLSPTAFGDLLARAATVLLVAALSWLVVVLLAVVVEALTGGRWRPARLTGAPPALRRLLLAGVLGVLAVAGTGPAALAERGSRGPASGDAVAALEGLPLPDRPWGAVPARASSPTASGQQVTVRPGDSLWGIAERLLPGADSARLVVAVAALHEANRAVVGPDPDLVRPGQRLHVPAGLGEAA